MFYYEHNEKGSLCGKGKTINGTILKQSVSTSVVINTKNGVTLTEVTVCEKVHYELYMDNELINKFTNFKMAKAMWKDFSD